MRKSTLLRYCRIYEARRRLNHAQQPQSVKVRMTAMLQAPVLSREGFRCAICTFTWVIIGSFVLVLPVDRACKLLIQYCRGHADWTMRNSHVHRVYQRCKNTCYHVPHEETHGVAKMCESGKPIEPRSLLTLSVPWSSIGVNFSTPLTCRRPSGTHSVTPCETIQ